MAVTRRKGHWEGSKGVKCMVTKGDLTLGGKQTMQYADDVELCT